MKFFSDDIKNKFIFFIIGDFSVNPTKDVLNKININNLNILIYKVTNDLVCNIYGVNLGAKLCETDWMFILDMDTIIDSIMAKQLLDLIK